ncbi:MAG TPA: hypothetical protein VGJ84_06895 [Polyangiaceae bacterium]
MRFTGERRGPAFFRIDLKIVKHWRLATHAFWGVSAELINATFSKEVIRLECNPGGCNEGEVGPITIPSVGVEAAF